MKITKELEKEILQVIDEYWSSYLKGDLQTWASYLPDDYRNIGTTKEEIWSSKKEIVDYTKKVIEQMVGMAEVRNKKIQIFPIPPYYMVHELGDLFIKVEDTWTFYAPARISSILEKATDGWKILHQHGSYPDSKTEEGEAFAFAMWDPRIISYKKLMIGPVMTVKKDEKGCPIKIGDISLQSGLHFSLPQPQYVIE